MPYEKAREWGEPTGLTKLLRFIDQFNENSEKYRILQQGMRIEHHQKTTPFCFCGPFSIVPKTRSAVYNIRTYNKVNSMAPILGCYEHALVFRDEEGFQKHQTKAHEV